MKCCYINLIIQFGRGVFCEHSSLFPIMSLPDMSPAGIFSGQKSRFAQNIQF